MQSAALQMATRLFLVSLALCLAFTLHVAGNVAETVCKYDSKNPAVCTLPPADDILYMGDSTMSHLFSQSKPAFRGKSVCKELVPFAKCNIAKYLGFTQVDESDWVRPGPTVGPACNVQKCHPGCSECTSCAPAKYVCSNNRSMEYIPIEFARDVEVQSTNGKMSSTQEHVGRYLMDHPKDLCVVSTGLHDAALTDQERMFTRNVLVYLELIRPGCKRIVWITSTAVRGDPKRPQNNTILRRRDQEVIALFTVTSTIPELRFVDVFEASVEWEHVDNVHLTQAWYRLLGDNLIGSTVSATQHERQLLPAPTIELPAGARFDPMTGKPLAQPAAPVHRMFDPMTGQRLSAAAAEAATARPPAAAPPNSQPPLFTGRISGIANAGYKKRAYLVAIKKSIAGLCDWTIITSGDHGTEVIKQRSPPRTIYLSLVSIQRDARQPQNPIVMLSSLLETGAITAPFVLLSGSTDMTFPHQKDKRMGDWLPDFHALIMKVASSPLVERWNVENLVGPYHPKMVPMPLGFLGTGCQGPRQVQYPCDKEIWADVNTRAPLASRPLTMMCTGRNHFGTNGQFDDRNNAIAKCKEGGIWADFVQQASNTKLSHKAFIASQMNVSFMMCPHGGGVDPAPKAFESLASGAIPIVQRSDLYDAYKVFPIAWVDDFSPESITEAKLKAWRDELAPRFDDPEEAKKLAEQLTMRYWWHYAVDGTSAEADPIYPAWPDGLL